MNKRQIIASLNKIANQLDSAKLHNEADTITKVMSRIALDQFRGNENFDEMFGPMDDEDDTFKFDQSNFDKMIEGLRQIFMPYGDEQDVVGDRMRDYNVDPEQPSYRDMKEVFRDLDDIINDPRSNIYHEQKVNVDGKMVNYSQLKNMILHECD